MNAIVSEVTVGMGCTRIYWSDREAYTVVAVSASGKTAVVQRDHAVRIDSNGMSDMQSYEYSPNPDAARETIRLTSKGWKFAGPHGSRVLMGTRRAYHDFSF